MRAPFAIVRLWYGTPLGYPGSETFTTTPVNGTQDPYWQARPRPGAVAPAHSIHSSLASSASCPRMRLQYAVAGATRVTPPGPACCLRVAAGKPRAAQAATALARMNLAAATASLLAGLLPVHLRAAGTRPVAPLAPRTSSCAAACALRCRADARHAPAAARLCAARVYF